MKKITKKNKMFVGFDYINKMLISGKNKILKIKAKDGIHNRSKN